MPDTTVLKLPSISTIVLQDFSEGTLKENNVKIKAHYFIKYNRQLL